MDALMADLHDIAKTEKLKPHEYIAAVHLETEAFSLENGLLTPSMKMKRITIKEKYQTQIDNMYEVLSRKK
jgi:long-chain acyl-CoA synthetase